MASPTQIWRPLKLTIFLFLLCISFSYSIKEAITSSKKLDQPVITQPEDPEIKCGSCPCGSTCGEQLSPPTSPPPPTPCAPPPPPPFLQPPPPPSPPPPKYIPSCPQNCNPLMPPPPPRFIYVPAVGNQPKPYTWIYYYSAAENRDVGLLILAALGGLGLSMATLFG